MLKQLLLVFLAAAGITLIVFGLCLTYSSRFFRYWYKGRDLQNKSDDYYMARYWTGQRSVLAGFGLVILYILYNEKLARYLMSIFY